MTKLNFLNLFQFQRRNSYIFCLNTIKPDEKLDKKEALKVILHKCQLNGPVLDHIQEKNMDLSSSSHHPN